MLMYALTYKTVLPIELMFIIKKSLPTQNTLQV